MTWFTRLEQPLQIETGDGQKFTVLWKPSVIIQDFNFTLFEFPNTPGTYVRRQEPKGRVYGIEFYFQGATHLEDSERFLQAAAGDKRQWRILHPFYDELRVQPLNLNIDGSKYNVTKITGKVMETIQAGLPVRGPSFEEEIASRKVEIDQLTAQDFAVQIQDIQPEEIAAINENIDSIESVGERVIELEEEQTSFRNKVLAAKTAITNVIEDLETAANKIQDAINFPGQVIASVRSRINSLVDTYTNLFDSIATRLGIGDDQLSRNDRVYASNIGATNISAMCVASVSNRDYGTTEEVVAVVDAVLSLYNRYIDDVDSFVTDNQTLTTSFFPNPDVIRAVQEIVNFTMSNLLEIALDSQQEYTVINGAESNVIILTHRVYGLDNDDNNIDRFIATNNIGLKNLISIPKDTTIKYLV